MTTPTTPSNNGAPVQIVRTAEDLVQGPHGQWLADNVQDFEIGFHILGAIAEATEAAVAAIPRIERETIHVHPTPVPVTVQVPESNVPPRQNEVGTFDRVLDRVNLWPALIVGFVLFVIVAVALELFSPGWTPASSLALGGVAGLVAFIVNAVAIISKGDRR